MVDLEPMLRGELERLSPPETFNGADWSNVLRRARPRSRLRRRRTLVLAAAVLALAGAGIAIAGVVLGKTSSEQEHSLLAGHTVFAGTNPVCTKVADAQFHCVLDRKPTGLHIEGSYRGTKVQTVDAEKRVDGGCVSTSHDGRTWECYVGELAVDRGIISPHFLGEHQAGPGHG